MTTQDSMLSINLGPDNCLHRVLQKNKRTQQVIYILLEHLDFIREDSQTYGPKAIRALSKLPDWTGTWNTLTISKDGDGIRTQPDMFKPHTLPLDLLHGSYGQFSVLELQIIESLTL